MVDMQWIALDLAFTAHYARNSKSLKRKRKKKGKKEPPESLIAAKGGKETVRRLMNGWIKKNVKERKAFCPRGLSGKLSQVKHKVNQMNLMLRVFRSAPVTSNKPRSGGVRAEAVRGLMRLMARNKSSRRKKKREREGKSEQGWNVGEGQRKFF